MNLLKRYTTGPWTTLALLLGITASFVYGVVRIRRHDVGGYLEAGLCIFVFYTYEKNYRRRTQP
jgi:hypothetical protein